MIAQPNKWSCFPTAVSILTEIPIDDIVAEIGHDGSRVVEPDKPDPWCREAFQYSEMVVALRKFDWTIAAIWAEISSPSYPKWPAMANVVLNWEVPTVVVIQRPLGNHCLAWDTKKNRLYDPLTGLRVEEQPYPVTCLEPLFRIVRG